MRRSHSSSSPDVTCVCSQCSVYDVDSATSMFPMQSEREHVPRSYLRHRAGNAGHDDFPARRHHQRRKYHEECPGGLPEVRMPQ